ncbi:MAG: AbrB/MazE/SpoVT family DNA-binding domain-containing protein [Spirochaetes bacterium]|nr:AbrB/MazE/SpoVT family DNA-binding domain-containing protein [Spirochaetota bacterium]HPA72435.1 AbrB/MazE/SpoVT family DNA-binding domain-containing protein [Spirochaetota bacterium]
MKIMERGQITIPKKFRDRYGIKPDTELDFIPVKEGLLLIKRGYSESPFRELYGILKHEGSSDDYIDQIRGGR